MWDPLRRLVDDLQDRTRGHVRVEPGPPTDAERRTIRIAAPAYLAGVLAYALVGGYVPAFTIALMTLFIVAGVINGLECLLGRELA